MLIDVKKARLLITGGAGFMGSGFIRFLLQDPTFRGEIFNLDLMTYAAHPLSPLIKDPRYHFIQGNILETEKIEELHAQTPFNAILHFAAETHVDRSITSPSPFVETNVVGTYRLLEFVRRFPEVHFHQISTDEVSGSLKETGLFDANSPYRPSSPYAASKAAADHFSLAYAHTYGLSCTLSHASNNYGPSQFPEKFIPLMILNCLHHRPLPIYGDGKHRRQWLYVDDHSRALATLLQKGKKGGVYNIGSGDECTNLALLEIIIKTLSLQTETDPEEYRSLITFVSDRPGHDFRYALDAKEIFALGWQRQTPLQEGIKKAVLWYLSHLDSIEKSDHTGYAWSFKTKALCP